MFQEAYGRLKMPKEDMLLAAISRAGIELSNIMIEVGRPKEKKDGVEYKMECLRTLLVYLEK